MTAHDERTYTLDEARRELDRLECDRQGHSWVLDARTLSEEAPAGIVCGVCGWRGEVVMGEKP